jgi:hypothetical protein
MVYACYAGVYVVDFEKMTNDIVSVSGLIRFVMIIDENGKAVESKIATTSYLLQNQHSSLLAMDMQILRKLLKLYDESIGENTSVHLVRKQVHVMIFYVKEWIIMVSCNRTADRHTVADISDKIEAIVNKDFR